MIEKPQYFKPYILDNHSEDEGNVTMDYVLDAYRIVKVILENLYDHSKEAIGKKASAYRTTKGKRG